MHHVVRGIYKYGKIRKESVTELPKWIQSIVPSAEVIRIVKSAEEKKGSDRVMKSRISSIACGTRKPDKLDLSVFILEHVYKTVVKQLHKSRKSIRRTFTKCIGYLFLNWNKSGFTAVEQNINAI